MKPRVAFESEEVAAFLIFLDLRFSQATKPHMRDESPHLRGVLVWLVEWRTKCLDFQVVLPFRRPFGDYCKSVWIFESWSSWNCNGGCLGRRIHKTSAKNEHSIQFSFFFFFIDLVSALFFRSRCVPFSFWPGPFGRFGAACIAHIWTWEGFPNRCR